MLADDRHDVVDLEISRVHQRVDPLHAFLKGKPPAQIERRACSSCDSHLVDELRLCTPQLLGAHHYRLRRSAVRVYELGWAFGLDPLRAKNRGGGQPRDHSSPV
jgi:hypothetical protein